MIPTAVRCSKASRAPLTPKRANKDFYKGTRQAFLPGSRRTGAPGRHVIGGKAKYRLIDEKVRVYVAPPIREIEDSMLRPYVALGTTLLPAHRHALFSKPPSLTRPRPSAPSKSPIPAPPPRLGGLTPAHLLRVAREHTYALQNPASPILPVRARRALGAVTSASSPSTPGSATWRLVRGWLRPQRGWTLDARRMEADCVRLQLKAEARAEAAASAKSKDEEADTPALSTSTDAPPASAPALLNTSKTPPFPAPSLPREIPAWLSAQRELAALAATPEAQAAAAAEDADRAKRDEDRAAKGGRVRRARVLEVVEERRDGDGPRA